MFDLKEVVQHRKDILLAEVAAWLHDSRKAGITKDWVPDNFKQWLETRDVTSIQLYEDPLGKWILAQSHGIAHFDKQEPEYDSPESEYISSPFGFEKDTRFRYSSPPPWLNKDNLAKREYARIALKKSYADSRIPINEIYLWSWAETTASLNKAAWVTSLLKNINLHGIFLEREFLLNLDRTLQTLIQRDDGGLIDLLNELKKKIPSSSSLQTPFSGLKTQVSYERGDSSLREWVKYLDYWLQQARSLSSTNKLTQRHWKNFLGQLESLNLRLKKVLSLLSWRLLSIRTNGLEYLFSASSIPDLLARKNLLTNAWNQVQKVLEEKYPLGLEVYRDENGPVFVVPDLDNLLDLSDSADNHKTLREYILEAFRQGTVKDDPYLAIDGEIVPDFKLDNQPWKGQPAPQELPPIGEHLKTPPILKSDSAAIAQQWSNLSKPQEICTVCGLRPQGPEEKAKSRKMCDVCEQRRADRAKAWSEGVALSLNDRFKQGKPDTIWMDEVADKNGRLALIVGTFDLTYWLDGTVVQSLAILDPQKCNPSNNKCPQKTYEYVAKNPSFARLRRVWETTRRFWQDVAPTDMPPEELVIFCQNHGLNLDDLWEGPLSLEKSLAGKSIGEKRSRLFLKGTLTKGLWPFHAYEMMVEGRKIAVLWVPPDAVDEKGNPLSYRGGFWVIENLEYLAGKNIFGRPLDKVLTKNSVYDIYEPSEYGKPREATSRFTLQNVTKIDESYVPLTPILAEARTFMAIVPADRAIEVVKAIRTKYEREMGKVRNRLPLHLGIIYAYRKMPLRAVLDAGRRMLRHISQTGQWKIVGENEKKELESKGIHLEHHTETNISEVQLVKERPDLIYDIYENNDKKHQDKSPKTSQYKQWHRIVLCSESTGKIVYWYVPAKMGDGKTNDNWYPYVFLVQNTEPTGRNRYYKAENPWNKEHPWLVHAGELQPGDVIYFTPATLDFEFLEVNARRFEIAYDEYGKRENSFTRPYLLDEIEELEKIWKFIAKEDVGSGKSRLSSSQIFAIRDKIEEKREEWFENPKDSLKDEIFKKLCKNLLINAQWRGGKLPEKEKKLKWLTDMAVRGYFTDAIYLYHHVMKDRPVGEEK